MDVKIKDTGRRRVDDPSPNELDVVTKPGIVSPEAGDWIVLKGVAIKGEFKPNISANPQPSKFRSVPTDSDLNKQKRQFDIAEVDSISFENPKWSLEGRLNMEVPSDRELLGRLIRLSKTKGLKQFICDEVAYSKFEESGIIASVNVRVGALTINRGANSPWLSYSLELYETA